MHFSSGKGRSRIAEKSVPVGEIAPVFVTTTELARVLGLTIQRVGQLAAEAVITQERRNCWNLAECVQDYAAYRSETREISPIVERLRQAQASEIESRIDQRRQRARREAIEAAHALVDEMVGYIRTNLYGLPARVTMDPVWRREIAKQSDFIADHLQSWADLRKHRLTPSLSSED